MVHILVVDKSRSHAALRPACHDVDVYHTAIGCEDILQRILCDVHGQVGNVKLAPGDTAFLAAALAASSAKVPTKPGLTAVVRHSVKTSPVEVTAIVTTEPVEGGPVVGTAVEASTLEAGPVVGTAVEATALKASAVVAPVEAAALKATVPAGPGVHPSGVVAPAVEAAVVAPALRAPLGLALGPTAVGASPGLRRGHADGLRGVLAELVDLVQDFYRSLGRILRVVGHKCGSQSGGAVLLLDLHVGHLPVRVEHVLDFIFRDVGWEPTSEKCPSIIIPHHSCLPTAA
mmetsp:Transcript_49985/g.143071  ORF Transcript_49985/g.143071 Transcript_49985/m.143071 type:complete len:288 (+) Transcript_49985:200-1063(+)